MLNLQKRFRKKGNLFVEQLFVLPMLIICVWLIAQLVLYSYSNFQANSAASDAASAVAQQLRGDENFVTLSEGDHAINKVINTTETQNAVENTLKRRVEATIKNNSFILFSQDDNGDNVESDIVYKSKSDKKKCEKDLKNNERVLCSYFQVEKSPSSTEGTIGNYQIVTRIKAPFNLIGNFIAFLGDDFSQFYVHGNSSAPIDMPGRFKYYNSNQS